MTAVLKHQHNVTSLSIEMSHQKTASINVINCITINQVLAFSALTLLVGRQEGHPACKKLEWWGAGVVICLEQGAD